MGAVEQNPRRPRAVAQDRTRSSDQCGMSASPRVGAEYGGTRAAGPCSACSCGERGARVRGLEGGGGVRGVEGFGRTEVSDGGTTDRATKGGTAALRARDQQGAEFPLGGQTLALFGRFSGLNRESNREAKMRPIGHRSGFTTEIQPSGSRVRAGPAQGRRSLGGHCRTKRWSACATSQRADPHQKTGTRAARA